MLQFSPSLVRERSIGDRWAVPVLFFATLLLYLVNLDRPGHPDEFHHILAARGLLETGEPRIAEGFYTRGLPFTWIVAAFFWLFGDSIAVARLPSVLATAALVAVLFLWLRREAGATAAWLAAGLYAVSPFAVLIAQFSRFYALHALVFMIGAWLLHDLARPGLGPAARLRRAVPACAAFAFASLLQPTTLIGFVSLAAWFGPLFLWHLLVAGGWSRGTRIAFGIVLCAAAVALLAGLWASGFLGEMWHLYRDVPLFNRSNRDAFWFYHFWHVLYYPTLWTATGLLALVALARYPRLGGLALVFFATAFLLHSFAGPKSLRYIAYAQPMLFVIWGLGLAALLSRLGDFLAALRGRLAELLPFGGRVAQRAGTALITAAILFCVLANPAWFRTAALLAGITVPPEDPPVHWEKAREELAPWFGRVEVVVTTEELATLYYFGRYDVRFSPSKLGELPAAQRHDFGIDPRTGRPVVGSLDALATLVRCHRTGLFLGPARHWGRDILVNAKIAAFLESRMREIPLPPESGVRAYVWEHTGADRDGCPQLPTLHGRPGT